MPTLVLVIGLFFCIRLYVSAIACTRACVYARVLERGGNEADGWGEEGGGGEGVRGASVYAFLHIYVYMCIPDHTVGGFYIFFFFR